MRRSTTATACLLVLTATGCARHAVKPPEPVTTVEVEPPEKLTEEQEKDLAAILKGGTLHFDLDEAALNEVSQERLQKIATALRLRPWASVRIEGNCDERGTEEYNLALGQRRADVARDYLVSLGVEPEAVQTVSYGYERPIVMGHDEDAWVWNRRDEIRPMRTELAQNLDE
jgi:peptidoglycan-associated lipoprotein